MTDDNVTELPVKFKRRGKSGQMLERVWNYDCLHDGAYLIDDKKAEVECAKCGEKLSPMWVLSRMASEETSWHEAHRQYHDEMRRLNERSRTKCQHCGQMTRISCR